jgi:hypothetical protein
MVPDDMPMNMPVVNLPLRSLLYYGSSIASGVPLHCHRCEMPQNRFPFEEFDHMYLPVCTHSTGRDVLRVLRTCKSCECVLAQIAVRRAKAKQRLLAKVGSERQPHVRYQLSTEDPSCLM